MVKILHFAPSLKKGAVHYEKERLTREYYIFINFVKGRTESITLILLILFLINRKTLLWKNKTAQLKREISLCILFCHWNNDITIELLFHAGCASLQHS